MLPATKRGLEGSLRENSSAAWRASSAAALVQLEDVVLEPELFERDGGAVERVGLDDVGTGFKVGAVDVFDQLGPGQHEHFGAILEVAAVPGEPLAAKVFLGQVVRVKERTH